MTRIRGLTLAQGYLNDEPAYGSYKLVVANFENVCRNNSRQGRWTHLTKTSATIVCEQDVWHFKFLNLLGWTEAAIFKASTYRL